MEHCNTFAWTPSSKQQSNSIWSCLRVLWCGGGCETKVSTHLGARSPVCLFIIIQFKVKKHSYNRLNRARGHVSVTDLDYWRVILHALIHANVCLDMFKHKHLQKQTRTAKMFASNKRNTIALWHHIMNNISLNKNVIICILELLKRITALIKP